MKKFSVCILLVLVSTGIYAQENQSRLDSLQQVVNALSSRVEETETAELNRAVWKGRAKYFNLGYVRQTLADRTYGGELRSDLGASVSWGKTY